MTSPTMTTATRHDQPRRARLTHYSLWQLRDFVVNRALPILLVVALLGYGRLASMEVGIHRGVTPAMMQRWGSAAAAYAGQLHLVRVEFVQGFVGTVVFLGALLGTRGMVSEDRKHGWYRFLFSKPVSAPRFYAQLFALHWIAFLISFALLAAAFAILVEPLVGARVILAAATVFFCYAGLAFLLSATTRYDAVLLVALVLLSTLLWDRYGASTSVAHVLLYLLPPSQRSAEIYSAAVSATDTPWRSVAWMAGYGATCVAGALCALRFRRLAGA